MSTYAYCDQPHPGSDDEARDWHDRYHRTPGPRVSQHETTQALASVEAMADALALILKAGLEAGEREHRQSSYINSAGRSESTYVMAGPGVPGRLHICIYSGWLVTDAFPQQVTP